MDCTSPLEQIVERCLDIGSNCLAVADHGTIAGALELKKIAPFKVIVAEEILTPYGEIMGVFLSEEIPSQLSVEETIYRIKAQNGLICVPHPYDRFRPSALNGGTLKSIISSVDIIEVLNARNLTPGSETRARNLMLKHSKLASGGSDAHSIPEIGNAYVEMPEFDSKDEFLKSLTQGELKGHRSSPLVHLISTRNKFEKH
jgi:predicted metal-dependent phosphoesterase TrpH